MWRATAARSDPHCCSERTANLCLRSWMTQKVGSLRWCVGDPGSPEGGADDGRDHVGACEGDIRCRRAQTKPREQKKDRPVPDPMRKGEIAPLDQAGDILGQQITRQRRQPPVWRRRHGMIETGAALAARGQEPHRYLSGVLTAIAGGHKQTDINKLLPWNYAKPV